jgi:predicted glycogen debranching enzyme
MLDGMNAVQLRYRLRRLQGDSDKGRELRIRPLTSLRDFHGLIRQSWADRFSVAGSGDSARINFADHPTQLHLRSDWATFASDPQWWFDFFYESDAQRGQDCIEDLFSPGEFTLRLPAATGDVTGIIQASIAPLSMIDGSRDLAARRTRLDAMTAAAIAQRQSATPLSPTDAEAIAALARAADAYVIAPPPAPDRTGQATVIAGYPWFADWGRDTSISIPGLMLATGRIDDAGRCLRTFASHRKNGIVPNVFDDRTGEPQYNTADASLWFILGACTYRKAAGTANRSLWDGTLAPACLDIIAHYRRGTDFNIAMDPQDKLITAGTNATQLTWMDAKRDGVTFTPRHGKAVEINALWHAALRELGEAIQDTDAAAGANLRDLADAVARSIRAQFWNADAGCLFDCLTPNDHGPGWHPAKEIRPNQLFAISLPHSPLTTEQQRSVLTVIRERLLTPFGVRTLDPADPNYRSRYEGNLFERDRAYHNGTAWPWLLGPFAEATLRVGAFSDTAKREARAALNPILTEMLGTTDRADAPGPRGCIGQIAEIYDGNAPQRPQGCPAQAWSVAEVLRALVLLT